MNHLRDRILKEVEAMEKFARMSEIFAADFAMSPIHWAGADARAKAMRECASMIRRVLQEVSALDHSSAP